MSHDPRRVSEDGDVAVVLQGYEAWELGDIDRAVADVYTVRGGQVARMQAYADPSQAFHLTPGGSRRW